MSEGAAPSEEAGIADAVAELLRSMRAGVEGGDDPLRAAEGAVDRLPPRLARGLEIILSHLRGEHTEDGWGFDEELAEALYPLAELLYDRWWRVQAVGVERVPAHGRAMLVANHAGGLFPFDAVMMTTAMMREHPLPRWPRFLVLDWAFTLPYLSSLMRRVGGVPAGQDNARRLLTEEELVMVFPEGLRGISKPFSERYRLERFGRGGFAETALRTGSPIVPVAVVGSEEIYPKLGESETLARLAGVPHFPLTPTFPWLGLAGLVPLPSRWRIEFLEPIDLSQRDPTEAEDRRLVFDLTEEVRERIQAGVYENLVARGSAFV